MHLSQEEALIGDIAAFCFASVQTEGIAKNTVITPNFLVWKFCGKAQFPHSFGRFANYAFPQNVHTRKSGEITVFFALRVKG